MSHGANVDLQANALELLENKYNGKRASEMQLRQALLGAFTSVK